MLLPGRKLTVPGAVSARKPLVTVRELLVLFLLLLLVAAFVVTGWALTRPPGPVAMPVPVAVGPVNELLLGVTLFDGAEAGPGPFALVATTVNVYEVPFASPVTRCVRFVVPACVSTPPGGIEVTV